MLHKIRHGMGQRDGLYLLSGIVETDETYVGGRKEGGKRGCGTEKTPVQVAVSLDEYGHPQFVRMEVLEDVSGESIGGFVEGNIAKGSVVRTDGFRSYGKALSRRQYAHEPERFDFKGNPEHLKWLHRIIGNAKAFVLGTYHGLGEKHMQAYLDEFCFRFNRRRLEGQLFDRLLNVCMTSSTVTYEELVSPVAT